MGKVNRVQAQAFLNDDRFEVWPDVFVGYDIESPTLTVGDQTLKCIWPNDRYNWLSGQNWFRNATLPIMIDFSHPDAVIDNVTFYTTHGLPFVLGTTGYDREEGTKEKLLTLAKSETAAASVIGPNMAIDVVFMTMLLEYAQSISPHHFNDWHLRILESHPASKADPSGTALSLARNIFLPMGARFNPEEDMESIRDKNEQVGAIGIPPEYVDGHGYHTYILNKPGDTVQLGFVHNINGREPYIQGTKEAVLHLADHLRRGWPTKVFSMQDIIHGKKIADVASRIVTKAT